VIELHHQEMIGAVIELHLQEMSQEVGVAAAGGIVSREGEPLRMNLVEHLVESQGVLGGEEVLLTGMRDGD